MNPIWGHVAGVITVILMLTFLGIWFWAWRKKHKQVFDRMACLPLEDAAMVSHDYAAVVSDDIDPEKYR